MFASGTFRDSWNYRIPNSSALSSPAVFVVSDSELCVLAFDAACGNVVSFLLHFESWFGAVSIASTAKLNLSSIVSASQIDEQVLMVCDSGKCLTWDAMSEKIVAEWTISGAELLFALNNSLILRRCASGITIGSQCLVVKPRIVSLSAALLNGNDVFVAFESENKTVNFGVIDLQSWSWKKLPTSFGVGSRPSVSASVDGKTVLVSASDSFCWNSEYQNKEVILFCDSEIQSQIGVLSYWKGDCAHFKLFC